MRDGRVFARGAADDKGNFLPLLHVACALARDGRAARPRPRAGRGRGGDRQRVGGALGRRGRSAAPTPRSCSTAAWSTRDTPAITVGLRGVVQASVRVRTAARDLHSGLYGGSVLNALHVLHAAIAPLLPGPDGRLREELRAGIEPASEAERASWPRLPPGDDVLAEVGGRPLHPGAGAEYYERNGADASLDVNAVHGGEPRTVVPAEATATLTMRLAPRQRATEIQGVVERLLRERMPEGAELERRLAARRPCALRRGRAGDPPGRRGDRAGDRHGPGAGALGRLHPDRRRAGRPRDPDDRHRLRARRRRHPRAERVLPPAQPRARRGHGARAAATPSPRCPPADRAHRSRGAGRGAARRAAAGCSPGPAWSTTTPSTSWSGAATWPAATCPTTTSRWPPRHTRWPRWARRCSRR